MRSEVRKIQVTKRFLSEEGKSMRIHCAAFSSGAEFVAVSGRKYNITIYDVQTLQQICILTGHLSEIWYMTFSENGKYLASVSHGSCGSTRIWDMTNFQELHFFQHNCRKTWYDQVEFSRDGNYFAVFNNRQQQCVQVFETLTCNELLMVETDRYESNYPNGLTCCMSTKYFYLVKDSSNVHIYEMSTFQEVYVITLLNVCVDCHISLSMDQKYLCISALDQCTYTFDAISFKQLHVINNEGQEWSIIPRSSKDMKYFGIGTYGISATKNESNRGMWAAKFAIYEMNTLQPFSISEEYIHETCVVAQAFSHDVNRVYLIDDHGILTMISGLHH